MTDFERLLTPGGALQSRLFARLLQGDRVRAADLPPGTRIGAWRIVEKIGEGGTAQVYRAERADGEFEQHVAIKLMRARDARLERSFKRERQILAGLNHPGIARLHDGGTCDDGRPWFALELVAGVRIDDYVRVQRLSWQDRVALIEQVSDALQYAHSLQLVHRDIKPSNILVDDRGRTRLLDFGIALAPRPGGLTGEPGALTPEYASPEQLRGDPATAQSDLYQLGHLLAIVLRGQEAFCEQMPSPPDRRTGAHLRSVVSIACAEEPSERYATAAAFRAALHAVVAGAGPRPSGPLARVRRLIQHRPIASLLVAVLVGLGLAIGVAITHGAMQQP